MREEISEQYQYKERRYVTENRQNSTDIINCLSSPTLAKILSTSGFHATSSTTAVCARYTLKGSRTELLLV